LFEDNSLENWDSFTGQQTGGQWPSNDLGDGSDLGGDLLEQERQARLFDGRAPIFRDQHLFSAPLRQVAAPNTSKPKTKAGFDTITLETLLGGVASLLIFLILVCILFLCLLRRRKSKTSPDDGEAQSSVGNSTSSGGEVSVYVSGRGVQNERRPQLNWAR